MRAEPAAGVAVKDRGDQRSFVGVWFEVVAVDAVAVGRRAGCPAAFGGFAFHAGDDAVDDGGAFELGEHAEHLDHHPSGGGGGVERFGGGPECDACGVEVFEDLR